MLKMQVSEIDRKDLTMDISVEYTSAFKKEDYHKIPLSDTSKTNLNGSGGSNLEFHVVTADTFYYIPKSFIMCTIKIIGFAVEDDITLENNWFPRLFSRMTLSMGLNQQIIEDIQQVGEVDTMLKFIAGNKAFKDANGQLSGWIPDTGIGSIDNTDLTPSTLYTSANPSYYIRKHIYNTNFKCRINWFLFPTFGFTEYEKPVFHKDIWLVLTIRNDYKEIFFGSTAAAVKVTPKIEIKKLEWWIPKIYPNDPVKNEWLTRFKNETPIQISFQRRSAFTGNIPTGTEQRLNIQTNQKGRPRFVFVTFKTEKSAYDKNNILFTGGSIYGSAPTNYIEELQLEYNGIYYPNQPIRIKNPDLNYYDLTESYQEFLKAGQAFLNHSPISFIEYSSLYPIFCFDLRAQDEVAGKQGYTMALIIKKDSAVPELKAYVAVIDDALYESKLDDITKVY